MKSQRDIKQSRLVTKLIKEYIPIVDIENDINNIRNMSISSIEEYKKDVVNYPTAKQV